MVNPWGMSVAGLVVFGVVAAVVVLLVMSSWQRRWVRVDETRHVAVRAESLDVPITRFLHRLRGAQVRTGQGAWTIEVSRAPWWTVIPAVALFPLGLLFLLFKERSTLDLLVRAGSDGSEIHLIGTTRQDLLEATRTALEALPRAAQPIHREGTSLD